MKAVAATVETPLPAERPEPRRPAALRVRRAAAAGWLRSFFFLSEKAPWLVRGLRPLACHVAFNCSRMIRTGTTANARQLLGPQASPAAVQSLARSTVASFYRFCCDMGRSIGLSGEQLMDKVEAIDGDSTYLAARSPGRGAIVVTAHMGSFEVGMAALRMRERKRIHVVFRRDPFATFERQRSELRRRLGVEEAPVDEGWTVWVRLRDALLADEVVVLQGDRVMPGQKGERVPFLGGHTLLPSGPIKLAMATGAPIVPVFTVRTPEGKIRLFIEPPIEVGPNTGASGPHPAMLRWAAVLEKYVRRYPDQWLMLQPVLCEDAEIGARTGAARTGAAEGVVQHATA